MAWKNPFGRGGRRRNSPANGARAGGMEGAGGADPGSEGARAPWEDPDDLPIWAEFFQSRAQLADFESEVGAYFQQRGMAALIDDGRVRPAERPEMAFGLSNVGQACAGAERGEWTGIISKHFDMVVRSLDESNLDERDLASLRDRLVVRLYDVDDIDDSMPFAGAESIPGLFSALMIDEPLGARSVHPDVAAEWDESVDEIVEIALDNVDRLVDAAPQQVDMGPAGVAWLTMGDSIYIASLICRLDRQPDMLGEHGTLVAAPVRHMFVALPINGPQVVQALGGLLSLVHRAYTDGPGSVSRRLYWYRDAQWTELPWALEDGKLQFIPPEEFVEMLNGLVE
jgi:hypothetical protein